MIAKTTRRLKSGYEYDRLLPVAGLTDTTVKRGANVADTVHFIPQAVKLCTWQSIELARELEGENITDTCQRLWQFLYDHVAYRKDRQGYEQIRSPRRTWHDRKYGVDCDCYTTFISTVLTNLGIPHLLRITKYREDRFQHIYPVAFDEEGQEVIIDCVTDEFNYEVPYNEKQDTPMDLQFLDGIDPEDELDDIELMGIDEIEGILDKFKAAVKKAPIIQNIVAKPIVQNVISKPIVQKVQTAIKTKTEAVKTAVQNKTSALKASVPLTKTKSGIFNKVTNTVKAGLHVVNRINPGTVVLRNGLLASLKLNVLNVAGRLKWTYLSDAEIAKRGIDKTRFEKLKKVREKLESIFFSAGGKPENLKSSILDGKGNKNNAISGLVGWDTEISLRELLGEDLFKAENVNDMEGFEGFGNLGEPITAVAVVTTATTVMTSLAGLIAAIGSIFPKKQKGSEDFEQGNGGSNATPTLPSDIQAMIEQGGGVDEDSYYQEPYYDAESDTYIDPSTGQEAVNYDPSNSSSYAPQTSQNGGAQNAGFWDQNKKWLQPSLYGAGGLSLLLLGYKFLKSQQTKSVKRPAKGGSSLSGLKSTKGKRKPKRATPKRRKTVKKTVRKARLL